MSDAPSYFSNYAVVFCVVLVDLIREIYHKSQMKLQEWSGYL